MTELAEELARAAPDWGRVDELRIPFDLSANEAVALVLTIDPNAAIRLFCEFPHAHQESSP